MNVFAKFDETLSMLLQDIKETKRHGHTFVRSFVRLFGRTDNMKTVYPPTNTVCGGYKNTHIKIGILVSRFSLYFKPPFVAEETDWTEKKNVFSFSHTYIIG